MSMLIKYQKLPSGQRRCLVFEASYQQKQIKTGTCLACVYNEGEHTCNPTK